MLNILSLAVNNFRFGSVAVADDSSTWAASIECIADILKYGIKNSDEANNTQDHDANRIDKMYPIRIVNF